jgi:hypothetical protein
MSSGFSSFQPPHRHGSVARMPLGVMNTIWTMNGHIMLLAILTLGACSDTFDRTYKTRAEAEYAGAIAAGRVPSWFPDDAMQIREVHSIDSNAVMVSFSYPKEHQVKIPQHCAHITGAAAPPPPFNRAWWPQSVPEHESTAERYAYHKCGELYVAILQSEGEGFVWSRR